MHVFSNELIQIKHLLTPEMKTIREETQMIADSLPGLKLYQDISVLIISFNSHEI